MNHIDTHPDIEAAPESFWSEGGQLKSTLIFIFVPAVILGAVIGLGIPLPKWALYGIAGFFGLRMFLRSFTNPEFLMIAFIVYIPFSKQIVIPLAPGLNGTNMLLMMLIISLVSISAKNGKPIFTQYPNTKLVKYFAIVSCISIITLMFSDGGVSYLREDILPQVKGWIEQFLIFFLFINLIQSNGMARRLVIYLMVGTSIALLYGVQETLDKMGLASIEKSRVLGPQLQPNDYGAFLVYNSAPFLAMLLVFFKDWKAWLMTPYFLITLKVLLSTFSRGALLALGASVFVGSFVKGKKFIISGGIIGIIAIILLPELIPTSLKDRFGLSDTTEIKEEKLDSSSETRLVLWKAAVAMTLESPVLGKGFKNFNRMKGDYTEVYVREGDTHNMYLWISSQMGLPALFLFLFILYRFYKTGTDIFLKHPDKFTKAVGLGGASMVAGIMVVNMFGSRMIGIDVCGYIWIYFAIVSRLVSEVINDEQTA
ncbi:hypothetical protein MNBD_GAMMA22-2532 [hydrothermal vent metagenome]|uniref:O-antigen ligase-related domain-containing protein n=1 Tax=hydrothermal vent metagenome TaxID=652676 RepID=A0A3B1A1I0_9ZZZZ